MSIDNGVVNIHGKDYKTVAKRVGEFREEYGTKYAIITSLVSMDEQAVVMKAEILDDTRNVIATGYAEEKRAASQINKTSALENCETSAIGRALANFGLGGGEYASADEVANAIKQQAEKPKQPAGTRKGLDFDVVRAKLAMLDTEDEINRYQHAIEAAVKNPTEKQRYVIQTLFANRRAEISERVA